MSGVPPIYRGPAYCPTRSPDSPLFLRPHSLVSQKVPIVAKPDTVPYHQTSGPPACPSHLSARDLPIPLSCCCDLDTCGVLERSRWRPGASFPLPPSPPARPTRKHPRGRCGSGANLRGQPCSPREASCCAALSVDPEAAPRPRHRHGSNASPGSSSPQLSGAESGGGVVRARHVSTAGQGARWGARGPGQEEAGSGDSERGVQGPWEEGRRRLGKEPWVAAQRLRAGLGVVTENLKLLLEFEMGPFKPVGLGGFSLCGQSLGIRRIRGSSLPRRGNRQI